MEKNHLRKNLLRRTSLLPEVSARYSILGYNIQAFTVDARLIETGSPHTTVVPLRSDSRRSAIVTAVSYIFELENGSHYAIELINTHFICAVGSRVSLLFLTTDNGNDYPVSIYNHADSTWHLMPNNQKMELLSRFESKVVVCVCVLPLVFLSMSLVSEATFFRSAALISCVLLSVAVWALRALRRRSFRQLVKRLQNLVEISLGQQILSAKTQLTPEPA